MLDQFHNEPFHKLSHTNSLFNNVSTLPYFLASLAASLGTRPPSAVPLSLYLQESLTYANAHLEKKGSNRDSGHHVIFLGINGKGTGVQNKFEPARLR